jgi:glycine/serine hydroxymethyltransferase
MREEEMAQIAAWMDDVVAAPADEDVAARVRNEARDLCARFPAPGLPTR